MIYGIGVDIVRVARMQAALERFGERLARRILTSHEMSALAHSRRPAYFLAKRFAAKEAVAKALGTGFRHGLALHHIGVRSDELGRPLLEFHGAALALLTERGISGAHLSLADEEDYALAFVTLTKQVSMSA